MDPQPRSCFHSFLWKKVIYNPRWVPGVLCTPWCIITSCFCKNVVLGAEWEVEVIYFVPVRVCFNEFVIEFCRWSRVHSNSLQQVLVLHTLLFQWEAFNKWFLGVSNSRHDLGAKVSIIFLFQWMKYVGRKTTLHYSKSILPLLIRDSVLRE